MNLKIFLQAYCILIIGLFSACGQTSSTSIDTNNETPFELSQELLEISGLIITDTLILAVQDEAGIIYFLNSDDWSINNKLEFGLPGDYEGVTFRSGRIFVLDSRGIIYEMKEREGELVITNMFALNHPDIEYEGIWVSQSCQEAYLVGRKGLRGKSESSLLRYIYKYSFDTHSEEASILIPVEKIWTHYAEMDREYADNIKIGSELHLSELIRDGDSGNWLILCSRPTMIIVLSPVGELIDLIELDPVLLPQPEAMSWTGDGALAIGTEGVLGPARIVICPVIK